MLDNKEKILLISIRPRYAEKIFDGTKTIELRKSKPLKSSQNSYVLIYVTSPVMEIWGVCKIEGIVKDEIKVFWKKFGEQTGITKEEYKSYYNEKSNAFGIKLKDITKVNNKKLSLKYLREIIPGFSPPQTYKYLNSEIKKHKDLKDLFL